MTDDEAALYHKVQKLVDASGLSPAKICKMYMLKASHTFQESATVPAEKAREVFLALAKDSYDVAALASDLVDAALKG